MGESAKIIINGKEMSFDSDRKLMDVLRNDCKCKSVKDGCSEGACGTCTVLIDGKPTKSCIQTIGRLQGKSVQTIEGFTQREKDVYSHAFAVAGAVQCGFCIPGMVICAKGLIDKNPNPTRLEIVAAIKNNICRCTGYKKIIDAIELAAKMIRENIDVKEYKGKVKLGDRNIARVDAKEKALGIGEYCDDIELEGMLHGVAVRTKYPRAKILKIDISEAKALKGVVDVMTAKDLPGAKKIGHIFHDWDVLIGEGETTRFIADGLALIVAEDEATAKKARDLVKIEYEELPLVRNPQEAMKEGAPLVHEGRESNLLTHERLVKGNADEVIAKSKYKVTKHYELPWTEHAFMEAEVAVAMPFNGDGIFVYSSDQSVYDTKREVSMALGIEPDKVVVENKYVGGGFGGKEDMSVQHYAAIMAYRTKRPVKFKLTRQESINWHPKRHPMSIDMTTACDENGILTAMKATLITDAGAYASLSGPVLQRACTHAAGPYNYQVIDIEGKSFYTNNPPTGPFRGFGVPQSCFATEMNINLLAEMCGLDPWEIRYRNAIRPGQVLPNYQIADEATGLVETLEAVKDIYYNNKNVGIACSLKNSGVGVGLPDTGRVRLVVKDGKVNVYSAASCIGQGIATVLYQIVGETLDLNDDEIIINQPNTATSPDSGTTSGSRQTLITGEACKRACEDLKKDLAGKTLKDLEGKEYYGEWLTITDKMGVDKPHPVSHVAYSYATQVCILNDDGTINKIVAAHDIGKAINPIALEGQIEGGVVMSLGYALTEKFPLEDCVPKVKFGTLGLFRADKTPDVESIIIEKPGVPYGYGATGIGEISSIPTAPAVALAYYKFNGEFQTELPLKNTPYSR